VLKLGGKNKDKGEERTIELTNVGIQVGSGRSPRPAARAPPG
jgi:hypothetical protein